MSVLEWENKFSVGVAELDEQHSGLIDLTNECMHSMKSGKSKKEINQIIKKLIKYSKEHFSLEEEYMRKIDFNGLQHHKKEHDRFIRDIIIFKKQYKNGEKTDISNIAEFLMKWLVNHILNSDQKYSESPPVSGVS